MNINVFGVGRSGTKAVQLYFTYLLLQKEGKAWLNYEPYFWTNRKSNTVSYKGVYHHINSPHLASTSQQFGKKHTQYLERLSSGSMSTVSKFIKGNGRIEAINEILQPKFSVVVVRDLYEVLRSVVQTEWNFYSMGSKYFFLSRYDIWEDLVQQTREEGLVSDLDGILSEIKTPLDKNAFYWYVMNLRAIKSTGNSIFFLDYANLNAIEQIGKEMFDLEVPFDQEKFNGNNIHSDDLLTDFGIKERRKAGRVSLMNEMFYVLDRKKGGKMQMKVSIGNEVRLAEAFEAKENSKIPHRLAIEKNELYDRFNNEVRELLAAKLA